MNRHLKKEEKGNLFVDVFLSLITKREKENQDRIDYLYFTL